MKNPIYTGFDTPQQMAREMEDDFDRWELPIEFDPGEERRALYRRKQMIERICEKWWSIFKPVTKTNA